jgi:hypothetical protein
MQRYTSCAERKRAENSSPRFREGFVDVDRISSVCVTKTVDNNEKLIQVGGNDRLYTRLVILIIKTTLRRHWHGPTLQTKSEVTVDEFKFSLYSSISGTHLFL